MENVQGAAKVFNGSSEHRWAVYMCAQLEEVVMESRDAAVVISPSETCSRTSRDVTKENKEEVRVTEERKLRTRYSAPCFLKQNPFSRPHCARPFLQYLRTPYCRVKGPLGMWVLSQS